MAAEPCSVLAHAQPIPAGETAGLLPGFLPGWPPLAAICSAVMRQKSPIRLAPPAAGVRGGVSST
jgi:hypothetical protein